MPHFNIVGKCHSISLWKDRDPALLLSAQSTNAATMTTEQSKFTNPLSAKQDQRTSPNNNNAPDLDYDRYVDENFSKYEDNYYNYDEELGWNRNLHTEQSHPSPHDTIPTYANTTNNVKPRDLPEDLLEEDYS